MGGVTPVVLGFDCSPSVLGWGAVRDDTGVAVACGYFPLDGAPETLRDVLRDVEARLAGHEPILAYAEDPYVGARDSTGTLEAGIALGMLWYAVRARWPWVVFQPVQAQGWRPKVGIGKAPEGMRQNERRAFYKGSAVRVARELGFELPIVGTRVLRPSDDAAEGACIARAA